MVTLPTPQIYWREAGDADDAWTLDADGIFTPTPGATVEVVTVGSSPVGSIVADTIPTISGLADLATVYGASITINTASSATGTNLDYALSGAASSFLSINTSTGQITGTAPSSDFSGDLTVTVSNSAGSASDTLAVTITSGAGATVPDQVTGLTATAGDTEVTLAWTSPANGGSAITDYQIEVSTDAGSSWTPISHAASTAVTYTHTGLSNGTAYTYRVAAINAVGTGVASATAGATPATVVPAGAKIAGVPSYALNSQAYTVAAGYSVNHQAGYLAAGDITSMQLVCPNVTYHWEGATHATNLPLYITAMSVEYPEGTFYPITVGGNPSFSVPVNEWAVCDPFAITIPKGAFFKVRTYVAAGVTTKMLTSLAISYLPTAIDSGVANTGAGMRSFNNDLGDLTQTVGRPGSNWTNGAYRPTILGNGANFDPFVFLTGDSIMQGTADAQLRAGVMQRSLPVKLPTWNSGIPGANTGVWTATTGTRTTNWAKYLSAFADHVMSNYGTNAFMTNPDDVTLASMITYYQNFWALGFWTGKNKIQGTILARATSTDGFITEANQTPWRSIGPGFQDVNAQIMLNAVGADVAIDVASALCGTNPDVWRVDGGAPYTDDGTHPNSLGYSTVPTTGVIDSLALFGVSE